MAEIENLVTNACSRYACCMYRPAGADIRLGYRSITIDLIEGEHVGTPSRVFNEEHLVSAPRAWVVSAKSIGGWWAVIDFIDFIDTCGPCYRVGLDIA